MHFVNGEGRILMIRRGIDGPGPHGWAGNWYLHQLILEGVLREGLKRFANVRVHLGHEVGSVEEWSHVARAALAVATLVVLVVATVIRPA